MIRTWRKWVLFLSLIVVLLVVYQRPDTDSVVAVSPTESDAEAEVVGDDAGILLGTQKQAPGSRSRSRPSGSPALDGPFAKPPSAYSLEHDVSIGKWMENYRQVVQNATVEDFELKRQQAAELDADAAYWLFEFYRHCQNAPRADWQLDKALSRAQQRVEFASGMQEDARLDQVLSKLDWHEQSFKLCSFLGPDFDTRLESLAWLETAADLGHMGALRLYHSQARALIAELVYQQPSLIPAFKTHARRYAGKLLETDHPQGYILMARMFYVGDVYNQDYGKAYAYARAAFLIGTAGGQSDAQNWMRLIGTKLPPSEIANAEQAAHELLHKD